MKTLIHCAAAGVLLAAAGCQKPSAGPPPVFPPTQVVAVEARRQAVSESLSLVGTLVASEMIEIKSEIEGVIQEVGFEEGATVEKGRLLFQLDESKLATAAAEAEANFKLGRANFERAQQLFKDRTISQQEYDQLAARFESAQATLALRQRELKDARIYAPFAGVMGARYVSPGQVIKKDTVLGSLVDINPVKAEISVPERFVSQLKLGQKIELTVAAFGRRFPGEVYFISPQVDTATRTALVRARLPNPRLELKPGMFANLDLALQLRAAAVVVPEAAVMMNAERASVYVVDKDQTAQIRMITPGLRQAGVVEILNGVEAGQLVIVEGVQKIRPGAKVKLAPPEAAAAYLPKAGGQTGQRDNGPAN
ncbi:MAG: efflux RND transporter periplasmic adaptor subunit [Verrucomicrobia bacterium]|nr:efflux RND transporter periplasmic adaptor subunit [Verrucomicrobiota bacterium]